MAAYTYVDVEAHVTTHGGLMSVASSVNFLPYSTMQ